MVSYSFITTRMIFKKEKNMSKTFEVMEAYTGNYQIKAYEDGNCVLDIILNDYNTGGACKVLKAFGYSLLRSEY